LPGFDGMALGILCYDLIKAANNENENEDELNLCSGFNGEIVNYSLYKQLDRGLG
jgi:hypothetical protein